PDMVAGSGDTAGAVIDPDMVALYDKFQRRELFVPAAGVMPTRELLPPMSHYQVRDTQQRGLCLRDGLLVAASLQGANADQEEFISIVLNWHLARQRSCHSVGLRSPIILGIRGGTRALSCGTGPEPQLHLEDVWLPELSSGDKDRAKPFTFYKTYGGSTHTFEAAAFPGLFLSTGPGEALGEVLALAPAPAATAFHLVRK
ncbi:I36RA protein, partial [Alaudala cheleensis]|nr:I36RA protein [Alaudala cheleensis]